MGSNTIEFRAHGFATRANDQTLFYTDDASCVIRGNAPTLRCRTWRGSSHYVDLAFGPATDIRVRVQYDVPGSRFVTELWNGDGSGYQIGQFPLTPQTYNATRPLSIGGLDWGARFIGSIAFFRWSAGVAGINGSAPADLAAAQATLLSYEFENNSRDSSPTGKNLAIKGPGVAYQDSPTYDPQVVLSSSLTNRAAFETLLDGRRSFSSYGSGNIRRYQWQQLGGAYQAEIKNPNSPLTTVVMPVAGTYTFRLEITDELGATNAKDVKVGAVATDDRDNVVIDNPDIAFLIGPITRSGTSPWPWYDQTEIRVADLLSSAMPNSPGDDPAAGTISVTPGSSTITGNGTSFRSLFACNGKDFIMVHYPVAGGTTGRRAYTVTECASDQRLTISPAYDATPAASPSTPYAKVTPAQLGVWTGGSNNWNYYDAVLAYYRVYYRTRQSVYRAYARTLADRWWKFPLDEGRSCTPGVGTYCSPPRVQALLGMMMRAMDGRPEMWPGIKQYVELSYQPWIGNGLGVADDTVYDIREAGYAYYFMVALARLHPDPAVRKEAMDKVVDGFHRFWKIRQQPDGSWRMDIGAGNASLGYVGKGTLPWQLAFILKGLIALHELTGDPEVLDSIQRATDYIAGVAYNSSCRGLWYTVQYNICQGTTCTPCTYANGTSGTCEGNTCSGAARPEMTDRTFSNATHEIFGYMFAKTGLEKYRTMGDNLFSANLGGTGGGPGADGGNGSFADAIVYGPASALGKEFGFVAGAGGAQKYLAYRKGEPQEVAEQTTNITFDLGQVPGSTKVKVSVTRPDSSIVVTTCRASPCAVTTDGRQGNHTCVIEYQNDSEETLSVSGLVPLILH